MSLKGEDKNKIIEQYGLHNYDRGSSEVQVALLTRKINSLRLHFTEYSKDYHSRRGLLRLISQRRSLLNYLKRKRRLRYFSLIKNLELRK
ncbi:MAG: 30S ribosomal protein S15 [Candidatus Dasytiphilus stammeri]